MTKTTKRVFTTVIVLVFVLAGVVVFLNVPASGDDLREVNTPTEFEGETVEVPFDPELMSNTVEKGSTRRERHEVDRWRHRTKVAYLARGGCKSILTTDRAVNKYDHVLFSIQVKASWCWRGGEMRLVEYDRDRNVGDEVWNLYRFRGWKEPVRSVRPLYAYNRQGAYFEACWTICFLDTDVWVAQTVRVGGTYTTDWKGR